MAKDAKPAEEGVEEAAPKKKNKKLLIIILAVVLLIVLAGGTTAFLLLKKKAPEDEEVAEETEKPAGKKKGEHEAPPVFVPLEAFTVNLIPETGDQYLQVTLSLEVEGPEVEAEIKAHMPKLRNNLTLLLSAKKASELLSREGKEKLADSIREEINTIVAQPKKKGSQDDAEGPVKSVLFTSFIIQ